MSQQDAPDNPIVDQPADSFPSASESASEFAPTGDSHLTEAPDRASATRIPPSTWDQAFNQLQDRVSSLIESIENESRKPLPENVEPDPSVDPLNRANDALESGRQAQRAELPLLMERLRSKFEPPANLSGILASLPEITAEQRQAVARLEHRLELLKARTDATTDALAAAVREIETVRRAVDQLTEHTSGSRQTEAELAANQREMAGSLNLLHDLVGRATETVKANAAWVEMLAESPDKGYQALRDQLTASTTRLETKVTFLLFTAAFAALASVVALVVALGR